MMNVYKISDNTVVISCTEANNGFDLYIRNNDLEHPYNEDNIDYHIRLCQTDSKSPSSTFSIINTPQNRFIYDIFYKLCIALNPFPPTGIRRLYSGDVSTYSIDQANYLELTNNVYGEDINLTMRDISFNNEVILYKERFIFSDELHSINNFYRALDKISKRTEIDRFIMMESPKEKIDEFDICTTNENEDWYPFTYEHAKTNAHMLRLTRKQ